MHAYIIDISSWWRHQMKTFPRYGPFVWRIHRSPVNCPRKGQRRGALIFSDLLLNKRSSKQSRSWWFETLLCPSWRHCNVVAPWYGHVFFIKDQKIRCLMVSMRLSGIFIQAFEQSVECRRNETLRYSSDANRKRKKWCDISFTMTHSVVHMYALLHNFIYQKHE